MSMKMVAFTLGLAVLATPALATKSRMEALNQNAQTGSFYIRDTRDVFHNPAYVTTHKDYVVMEVGAGRTADSSAAPRGEAGFFRGVGNFAYGLYLGNDNDVFGRDTSSFHMLTSAETAYASGGSKNFLAPDNTISLFFGGDSGIQWGAHLYYDHSVTNGTNAGASYTECHTVGTCSRVERKHTGYGADFGAVVGNIDVYGKFGIHDQSEGALNQGDHFDADIAYTVGATYGLQGWTFGGEYLSNGYEASASDALQNGPDTNDMYSLRIQDNKGWWLAAGRVNEINDKARFFFDTQLTYSKAENEYSHLSTTTNFAINDASRPTVDKSYALPMT